MMKAQTAFLCSLIALLALVQVGGWAQEKYQPKDNEEIYGTWVNDKGSNPYGIQKEIITVTGWKEYLNVSDSVPVDQGGRWIDSKWTDSEGNIYYKSFGTITTGPYKGYKWKALNKLSKSATFQESVVVVGYGEFDSMQYPSNVDPKDSSYKTYYRANE